MTAATDNLSAGLFALTEAVRGACADPADAVRLLSELAGYAPAVAIAAAPIGAAIAAIQSATASLARRAALASLALACADYQPTSQDDALAVRADVTALLDAEIIAAADAGDGTSYAALRTLRAAVIADLTTRGAQLPRLTLVTSPVPMPSLVLSYRLYGDASRADELTARAGAPASLFLPTEFRALSA